MRISDWSSDVCSSDLHRRRARIAVAGDDMAAEPFRRNGEFPAKLARAKQQNLCGWSHKTLRYRGAADSSSRWKCRSKTRRSEESRVGEEWVSTFRSRWAH